VPRLSMALCPACERANPPDARFCGACGSPLVTRCPSCETINVRTRTQCHHCGHTLSGSAEEAEASTLPGALDEPVVPLLLGQFDGEPPEPGWTLSLRADALAKPAEPWPARPLPPTMVADPDAPRSPAGAWPTTLPPPQADVVEAEQAARPLADPAADPAVDRIQLPAASPPRRLLPTMSDEERAQAKVRRRASVRADQAARRAGVRASLSDVLVMEPDPESRAAVCAVLEGFGFRVHLAISVAEAQALSLRRRYAAVFLGMARDAVAAAALCQQLHDARQGRRPLALIGIGDPQGHADRVRMQLAGADAMLMRPVQRGALARALDTADVPLPRDPRLH